MDRRAAIPVAVAIGLLLLTPSACVTTEDPYPIDAAMEQLTGTWQNTEYNGADRPAKRVVGADGILQIYANTYDETHVRTAKLSITKAWMDEANRLWFKARVQYGDSGELAYELSRIDMGKMDMTILWSNERFPKEWDPVNFPSCFYRK